jgi:hypothetical protein
LILQNVFIILLAIGGEVMEEKIKKYRSQFKNATKEELQQEQERLNQEIGKMVFNSDLFMYAAIIETLLNEQNG